MAAVSGQENPSIEECEHLVEETVLLLKNANAVHLQVVGKPAFNEDLRTFPLSGITKSKLKSDEHVSPAKPYKLATGRVGRREYNPVYDFLILECLRVFAQREECIEKVRICALLKAFDPNSDDRSVSSKLNTWHEDKFDKVRNAKGYVSWVRPKTNNIKITGRGEAARKELFQHAKPFSQKISDLFENTFGFPHRIEPS